MGVKKMGDNLQLLASSGLIVILLAVCKSLYPSLKDKNARLIPAVAVGLGIVAAFLTMDIGVVGVRETIVAGILAGAASVGINSGQKALRGK